MLAHARAGRHQQTPCPRSSDAAARRAIVSDPNVALLSSPTSSRHERRDRTSVLPPCGSRRCACWRPDPPRPASTPGCHSRGEPAASTPASLLDRMWRESSTRSHTETAVPEREPARLCPGARAGRCGRGAMTEPTAPRPPSVRARVQRTLDWVAPELLAQELDDVAGQDPVAAPVRGPSRRNRDLRDRVGDQPPPRR